MPQFEITSGQSILKKKWRSNTINEKGKGHRFDMEDIEGMNVGGHNIRNIRNVKSTR